MYDLKSMFAVFVVLFPFHYQFACILLPIINVLIAEHYYTCQISVPCPVISIECWGLFSHAPSAISHTKRHMGGTRNFIPSNGKKMIAYLQPSSINCQVCPQDNSLASRGHQWLPFRFDYQWSFDQDCHFVLNTFWDIADLHNWVATLMQVQPPWCFSCHDTLNVVWADLKGRFFQVWP